jgi:hypothetical protein
MQYPSWLILSINSRYSTKPSNLEDRWSMFASLSEKERNYILNEIEERKEEKEDKSKYYFDKWFDIFQPDDKEVFYSPWRQHYVDERDPMISRPKGDLWFHYNGDKVYTDYLCHHGDIITGSGRGRRLGHVTFNTDWDTKFYKA